MDAGPTAIFGHGGDGFLARFDKGVFKELGALRACFEASIDQPLHLAAGTQGAQAHAGGLVAVRGAGDGGVIGDAIDAKILVAIKSIVGAAGGQWRQARSASMIGAEPGIDQ